MNNNVVLKLQQRVIIESTLIQRLVESTSIQCRIDVGLAPVHYRLYVRTRVTDCRFVQVADSFTWSFQACTSFTMSIKKKLITRAIK